MKIVLKQPLLQGDRYYAAGAVIEVNDIRAKELLALGHAKEYTPPTMQTADVEPTQKAVAKRK